MERRILLVVVMSLFVISPLLLGFAPPASAINARPFTFIGKADDPDGCGDPYAGGARIVTAAWLGGIGLPDNGGSNVNASDPEDLPNKKDQRFGLLLSKNGAQEVCVAAGARILALGTIVVDASDELGFDYRNGSHCGGGAPRFNVSYDVSGTPGFAFVGNCAAGITTPSTQDDQWSTVRWNLAAFGVPVGATITAITIIFDEGTPQASPASGDTAGIGLAVIDNIFIAGQTIRKGAGIFD